MESGVEVSFRGPETREVESQVSLSENASEQAILTRRLPAFDLPLPLMFGEYISEKISTTTPDGWSEMSSAKSDNFRNRRESGMWKTPVRSPYPQKRGLGCETTGHDYTAHRSSTGQPRLFGAGRAWVE